MSLEVIVPGTGELLDLREQTTPDIADQIQRLLELRREIDRFNRAAQDVLAERLLHEGRKGYKVDGFNLRLKPVEKVWDTLRLSNTLDELAAAGTISQAKAEACITQTPKVNAREVQALLDDPRTAPEISLCFELSDARRSVEVKRA